MTNILYFHGVVRDTDSVSSSSHDEQATEDEHIVKVEAGSLYSVLGKACLACARPQVELISDDDTSFTTGDVDDQLLAASVSGVNLQGVSNNKKLDGDIADMSQFSVFKCFSLDELKIATRNFRPSAAVKGYLGLVYKGWVDEHTLNASKLGIGISVAIKWLKQEEYQDQTKWLEEVNFLGQLYHPNLVRLFGYCLENGHRLLVYESVAPRSLEDHLYRRNLSSLPFSWTHRMKIALGAAKGLAFLHSVGKIIHPNFVPSSIIVDKNYDAKIFSFTVAKEDHTYPYGVMEMTSGDISRIMNATSTYASPEYLAKGYQTDKSDVYSFGLVLLEILSGRPAFDKNMLYGGEADLVKWAIPYIYKRTISHVLDHHLEGQYSLSGAEKFANLSLHFLAVETRLRPSMNEVVNVLQELQG